MYCVELFYISLFGNCVKRKKETDGEKLKLAYPAIITYCEEDKSYSVEFPDLKGCGSEGFSLIEAIEMGHHIHLLNVPGQ